MVCCAIQALSTGRRRSAGAQDHAGQAHAAEGPLEEVAIVLRGSRA